MSELTVDEPDTTVDVPDVLFEWAKSIQFDEAEGIVSISKNKESNSNRDLL